MDENTVIQSVLAGDINKYEQLVTRYHVGLIIHCERIIGDRASAEDIAQESFVKATPPTHRQVVQARPITRKLLSRDHLVHYGI